MGLITPKPDFFVIIFVKVFFRKKLTDKNSKYFE